MLIDNDTDLRLYAKVNFNFTFDLAVPAIRQAERDYIRPALGEALYADLQAHYDGSGSGGESVMDTILQKAQEALGLLSMKILLPMHDVQVSDAGLHVTVSDTHKSPYAWQIANKLEAYHFAGLSALEDLLVYLEEHGGSLESWTGSEAFLHYNDSLLRNAVEFQHELSINGSRVTYVDLKPALRRAWDLDMKPVLGADFCDELIAHLQSEDSDSGASDAKDAAIAKLRPALAYLAIAQATEITFRRVNSGLVSTRLEPDRNNNVDEVDKSGSSDLRRNAYATGMALLAQAHGWLDAHYTSFPTYADGPGYRAAGAEEIPVEDRIHNAGGGLMM